MKKLITALLILCLCTIGVSAKTSPFCTLDPEKINSTSFILLEADTGTIVIEQNADKKLPMASITKLMVLLIADEYIESGKLSLTDVITGTSTAKETPGSRVYLDDGEEMSLEDILKCISIPSANDAAVALAEHIAGSEAEFVKLMNKRASEMGLKNTHYVTASGLDAEGHYSTARDIAILSKEIVLNHPRIMEHAVMTDETIRGGSFPLINTNNLISSYEYATGLKTGTTENAGYCLAATAEKNGVKLIAVLLGADSSPKRFSDAKTLFSYAYSDFSIVELHKKGNLTDEDGNPITAVVERGNKARVTLAVDKAVTAYIPSKFANKVKVEFSIDENLVAPIKKGSTVGEVKIYAGDVLVETRDIVTSQDVKKMNIFQAVIHVLRAWLSF